MIEDAEVDQIDAFGHMNDEGRGVDAYPVRSFCLRSWRTSPQCVENGLAHFSSLTSLFLKIGSRRGRSVAAHLWHERFEFPELRMLRTLTVHSASSRYLSYVRAPFLASLRNLRGLKRFVLKDVLWSNGRENGGCELASSLVQLSCPLLVCVNDSMDFAYSSATVCAEGRTVAEVEWALNRFLRDLRREFSVSPFSLCTKVPVGGGEFDD